MDSHVDNASRRTFWILAWLGLAIRLAYVYGTRDQGAHPDLFSFSPTLLPLTHPFDTSPREPVFVWWLWLLGKTGIHSVAAIRAAGTIWFVPSVWLLFRLARRWGGPVSAWIAIALFAFLPAQIQGDSIGLRHLLETTGLLVLLLFISEPPDQNGGFFRAAGSLAFLTLTRLTFATSGGLLLAWAALRTKRWVPLLAGIPAVILLLFHFHNNQVRHGDPLYSVNLHSYWFSNLEFIGRPGFPATDAERIKNTYKKSLTYRQWAFEYHTPAQYMKGTFVGFSRFFWDFFSKVYFRTGLPTLVTGIMLLWYLISWGFFLWLPAGKKVALWILFLVFPFGFIGHVFWAGRFFLPFTPLVLILMGQWIEGLGSLLQKLIGKRGTG